MEEMEDFNSNCGTDVAGETTPQVVTDPTSSTDGNTVHTAKHDNIMSMKRKYSTTEENIPEDTKPSSSSMSMEEMEDFNSNSGTDVAGETTPQVVTHSTSSTDGNTLRSAKRDDIMPVKRKYSSMEENIPEDTKPSSSSSKKMKEEEEQDVWKWWEEKEEKGGTKWNFLEHKGPVFAPAYERLPSDIKFFYDGNVMALSEPTEEVATFYALMLKHVYTTKEIFNTNFFKDWQKVMTDKEKEKITDLSKCNFEKMHDYLLAKSEELKTMSIEENLKITEENEKEIKEYGFCIIDGHKQRIGNIKIEPPGLFLGKGEHPKMGRLKKRVTPEDVIINCSKDSKIPKPPDNHNWKEVRHDKNVAWLASWREDVQGKVKYVMLDQSSKLKGKKDWQKYETARKLGKIIGSIRQEYQDDFESGEMGIKQRAVALYFIDKLALRAGNEKGEDQADTVGCCSLRFEHIFLHSQKDGKDYVVVFDFLEKGSTPYKNEVSVEERVFKNLQLFMQNKSPGDDLFDKLNANSLNKYLNSLMDGLTCKVFRTYNASFTFQQQLDKLTKSYYTVQEKILAYDRANRAVAILCNHQRDVSKTYAKSELQATDKEVNNKIALVTSKLNYLDPRITVAWCKKHNVPIEKIYNKSQIDKFLWAIEMAGPDYRF